MGKARNDLEYEKFTTTSAGDTAVRVLGDLSVQLTTSDIQIGAVEIKDASSENRVTVDSSGRIGVIGEMTGSVSVTNFPDTQSVSVTNFPAVQAVSDGSVISELQTLNSLVPSKFDYIGLAYDTSGNLTSSEFKLNGSSGTVVSTLALAYDTSSNLVSVTKL